MVTHIVTTLFGLGAGAAVAAWWSHSKLKARIVDLEAKVEALFGTRTKAP